MKKVTTESGSVYLIDTILKTWERVTKSNDSGKIRTNSGTIKNEHPLRIEIGEPIRIFTDQLNPKSTHRLLQTSLVISIEEV